MTSGVKTAWPERACALAAALLLLLAAPAAWALDLPGLMALLAQRKSGEARFTEERTVSTIDGPLLSSGTLSFAAPDRFARHTLLPRAESIEVQGNNLLMKRGSRTRQITLDAVPELAALIEAVRGTLNGDAGALLKHFRAEVRGGDAKWVLTLSPLDAHVAAQVRQVEIAGTGPELRSVELRLAGGDRSLMQIEPLVALTAPK